MITLEDFTKNANGTYRQVLSLKPTDSVDDLPSAARPMSPEHFAVSVDYGVPADGSVAIVEGGVSYLYSNGAWAESRGPVVLEELEVDANGTYKPDEGIDGYSKVAVNVANYSITETLKNMTAIGVHPTYITTGETLTLTYAANEGYIFPSLVDVVGATSDWDWATGTLIIMNPTEEVKVSIRGMDDGYQITKVGQGSYMPKSDLNPLIFTMLKSNDVKQMFKFICNKKNYIGMRADKSLGTLSYIFEDQDSGDELFVIAYQNQTWDQDYAYWHTVINTQPVEEEFGRFILANFDGSQ